MIKLLNIIFFKRQQMGGRQPGKAFLSSKMKEAAGTW